MNRYEYIEQIKSDIKDHIEWNGLRLEDVTDDELWACDSITGNASGSYYCNAYKAEEALCHAWGIIEDMISEGFIEAETLLRGPEAIDVCVRCYLLGEALAELKSEAEE